jgi:hypothetical protein
MVSMNGQVQTTRGLRSPASRRKNLSVHQIGVDDLGVDVTMRCARGELLQQVDRLHPSFAREEW